MNLPLAVVGVSHETAPVEIREQVAYGVDEARSALLALRSDLAADECVLLSTCNRTEAYIFPATRERTRRVLLRLFRERIGGIDGDPAPYAFEKWGADAAGHLLSVTAGLDAMVTGEAEIQGQVRDALELARSVPATPSLAGPVLNRLFQTALAAGGQVRSETGIGEGTASVASVAVELAGKIFGSLHGKRILVLGAGMTGKLILTALAREGVQSVAVANRTYDRAVHLARKYHGQAVPFERISDILATVDIVLSSTAAPHPVLTRAILSESFTEPRRRPLLVIDIAIPRDVDPAVGDEPGVFLYNVDDLRSIVEEHVQLREEAIPEARSVLAEHRRTFLAWHASREVVPVIRAMRERATRVKESELGRLFARLAGLRPEERALVEEFARRFQNKLLHAPTVRLKKGMADGSGPELVEAVRFLYGVGDEAVRSGDESRPSPRGTARDGDAAGPVRDGGAQTQPDADADGSTPAATENLNRSASR